MFWPLILSHLIVGQEDHLQSDRICLLGQTHIDAELLDSSRFRELEIVTLP